MGVMEVAVGAGSTDGMSKPDWAAEGDYVSRHVRTGRPGNVELHPCRDVMGKRKFRTSSGLRQTCKQIVAAAWPGCIVGQEEVDLFPAQTQSHSRPLVVMDSDRLHLRYVCLYRRGQPMERKAMPRLSWGQIDFERIKGGQGHDV
jgi:hypothetical protein